MRTLTADILYPFPGNNRGQWGDKVTNIVYSAYSNMATGVNEVEGVVVNIGIGIPGLAVEQVGEMLSWVRKRPSLGS